MIRDEIMDKLGPLWQNEEFVKALAAAESEDAAIKLFADNGVDLNAEEIAEIKANAANPGELGEDDLEEVAGGVVIGLLARAAAVALGWCAYQLWLRYRRTRGLPIW